MLSGGRFTSFRLSTVLDYLVIYIVKTLFSLFNFPIFPFIENNGLSNLMPNKKTTIN